MRELTIRTCVVVVALVAALSGGASGTAAQQGGQPPPFQAVVQALIDLVADPQPDRMRQFMQAHLAPAYRDGRPPEWHASRIRELRAALGRAELLNLVFERPGERRALLRSGADGQLYVLLFKVTDDVPPKIADVTLERGVTGTAASAGGTPVSAESRARALLDHAFRTDPATAEKWLLDAYAPEFLNSASVDQHLNVLAQIRDEARDIEIISVTQPSATEARAVYRSRLTGEWRELAVQVEPGPPNRLTTVSPPRRIPPPASHATEPAPTTLAEQRAALEQYARRLADADLFSGVVLIARGEDVIFQGAYGAASREYAIPNTVETRLGIGSINKMFTAVAILQLVEGGKLSLDDPVSQHLPGVLPPDVASRIRIEHLLTHTSGLGDFLFTPEMQNRSRANYRRIPDYLPLLANAKPAFEPGTGWGYSNAGFLLLGAILERVSGVPYDEYVQRNVFDRAGMTHSGPVEIDLAPTGLAMAYQREFQRGVPRLRSDRYVRPVRVTPAGGGYSTATDLLRFMAALRANRLLSPSMTQLMLSPKPELGSRNYGFGSQIFTPDGRRFGHTGGGHGTSASLEYDAASDLTVIVLGNMNTGAQAVRARAWDITRGAAGQSQ
ncbi:MAG TPA: serine hydrolase domain-containing protein [Vicinamibacterales bacterium]|nr:serine hydrolase domain-containing protein [Vicinamibacterales bacterium]